MTEWLKCFPELRLRPPTCQDNGTGLDASKGGVEKDKSAEEFYTCEIRRLLEGNLAQIFDKTHLDKLRFIIIMSLVELDRVRRKHHNWA